MPPASGKTLLSSFFSSLTSVRGQGSLFDWVPILIWDKVSLSHLFMEFVLKIKYFSYLSFNIYKNLPAVKSITNQLAIRSL